MCVIHPMKPLSREMERVLVQLVCLAKLDPDRGDERDGRTPCRANVFERTVRPGIEPHYNELYSHDGTFKALESRGLVTRRVSPSMLVCARPTELGFHLVEHHVRPSCSRDGCPLERST